jgi:uncharacterized membrane protein YadS
VSPVLHFALPVLFVLIGLSQWFLARAKRALSVEDKARITDAMSRPWWVMLVFAGAFLAWSFGLQSVPRHWHWWSLFGLMLVVFLVSALSARVQWRSLLLSGVAQSYLRTQFWVFVVLYAGMLLFFAAILYDARILRHH